MIRARRSSRIKARQQQALASLRNAAYENSRAFRLGRQSEPEWRAYTDNQIAILEDRVA